MCGIFGYVGDKNASHMVMNGLRRLEYRGYDSWGIAVLADREIHVCKDVGSIVEGGEKVQLPLSTIGIGHTRWATHGGVSRKNAHPHFSTERNFVLAHNGIVENYQELKGKLRRKGFMFDTETDSEVIVRLIEKCHLNVDSMVDAVELAFAELEGRNTIIILSRETEEIIAVRNGSPLVIGVDDKAYYLASDTLSFSDKTLDVVFLDDMQLACCSRKGLDVRDIVSHEPLDVQVSRLNDVTTPIEKDGYDHFMLKEIFEQRETIGRAVDYGEKEIQQAIEAISKSKTVVAVGSGGAYYAAEQIAQMLRRLVGVSAIGVRASEVDSYLPLTSSGDVAIAVSQSGETADTIQALNKLRARGLQIISVVNMEGSTISRMSDMAYYSRSGSEICVLSTKTSSAQMAFGYLLSKAMVGKYGEVKPKVAELMQFLCADYLTDSLSQQVSEVAKSVVNQRNIFLLGKGNNFMVANIGALNIKEASYVHAEGFSAGELKHGVIALIDEGVPVISIVDNDEYRDDMIAATAEVKARGAYVIGLGVQNNDLFDLFLPLPNQSGIEPALLVNIIPCQLLAYHLAVLRGINPDRPRNLAKSVTVI